MSKKFGRSADRVARCTLAGHMASAQVSGVVLSFLLYGNSQSMQTVLQQTCKHLQHSTPVVVHVNAKSPVADLDEWTSYVHRLVRPNGSAPILANPERLRVHRQRGTILLGHVLNFRLAVAHIVEL